MDDPVMPKEEEEMKAVEALSRAMLGSFRNLHMQIQVIHVIQFSHVFPCCFSFTKWKAVIRNINTNLNELLVKSVLYKAGWILLDSVGFCWILSHVPYVPLFIQASSPRDSQRSSTKK
jgi:hypothetical protein